LQKSKYSVMLRFSKNLVLIACTVSDRFLNKLEMTSLLEAQTIMNIGK